MMRIAETSKTALAAMMSAVRANWTSVTPVADQRQFDSYERAPLQREELSALFESDLRGESRAAATELRKSELFEKDKMRMIRSALYPAD